MKIHWHNVIALALAVTATVLFLKHREAIAGFVGTVQHIGPGHDSDEMTLGLIALGIICVSIVAVIKILTRNKN
jgi:hypothetical protein